MNRRPFPPVDVRRLPGRGRAATRRRLSPLAFLLVAFTARAEWLTQSFVLSPGWNALYFHVDTSYASLDQLIGSDPANPITEVWLWEPPVEGGQFVTAPQQPTSGDTRWREWNRAPGGDSLVGLPGNVACLVRNPSGASYTWNVKGRVVPPQYRWTVSGENFLGFPTPPTSPPVWETFLDPSPTLRDTSSTVFYYPGGETGAPAAKELGDKLTRPVTRGYAYWIRNTDNLFNDYFGPVAIALQDPAGIHFGESAGQYRLILKNVADKARTVQMQLLGSESDPNGVTPPTPPLLVRGAVNLTNLTYGFTALNGAPASYSLAAAGEYGSQVEIVLGLNRSAVTQPAGTRLGGILRFTDDTGLSQVDAPVTATVAGTAGLWVGGASVSTVQASLKEYARATDDAELNTVLSALGRVNGAGGTNYLRDPNSHLILVTTTNGGGSYLSTNFNTAAGAVPRPFPLRLIVHQGSNGVSRLLQRVYVGLDAHTNAVLALNESALSPTFLPQSRRISAAHLPWTAANNPWLLAGTFGSGQTLSTEDLAVPYDDQASNPFLHTYHPDHDNLNATFDAVEEVGVESYRIERRIRLTFTPPGTDFASLTAGSGEAAGLYLEEIQIKGRRVAPPGGVATNETRQVVTSGAFLLHRISSIPRLTPEATAP